MKIKIEKQTHDREGFKIHYRNEATLLAKRNKALMGENVGNHVVSSNEVDYEEWNQEINEKNSYNDFHNNQRRSVSKEMRFDSTNINIDSELSVEKKRMSRRQRQKRNKLNK